MFSSHPLFRFHFCVLFLSAAWGLPALQTKTLPGNWTDALTVVSLPDGSMIVAQRSGQVDILVADGDQFLPPVPWADLGDNGKSELLGLTVDPDFLSSGYVFAALRSRDVVPVLRITRWRSSGGLAILNRILVDDLPTGTERAGGVLKYGPDGKLWLGVGDGGAPAADVKPATLRGVLLRYNEDGTIPSDNPDPDSPVWCWGFRDPGALAWQPGTGRLYALDRGPPVPKGTNDPLDIIVKGADYGWPKYMAREYGKGVTRPVTFSSSGHSWIPNGAVFVTKGEWAGSLLFAGSGQGFLYRLSLDPKSATKITFYDEMIQGDLGPLMDVTLGTDDQAYLLSKKKLYKITP